MKINFDAVITNLERKPFVLVEPVVQDGQTVKPAEHLTLKTMAIEGLMTPMERNGGNTGQQKVERAALAERINGGGEIEIKPEEIVLLKELIDKTYPHPLAVARAYEILNG